VLGLSVGEMGLIERGDTTLSLDEVAAFARRLDIDALELLTAPRTAVARGGK
jgi:hypothetical protein